MTPIQALSLLGDGLEQKWRQQGYVQNHPYSPPNQMQWTSSTGNVYFAKCALGGAALNGVLQHGFVERLLIHWAWNG
jgi:hypothetical protein